MKNLIINPLTRAAIAGAAVWLASVFMAHGQNKPDDLKQTILAQARSSLSSFPIEALRAE